MKSIQADVLPRIEEALRAAAEVLNSFANNVVNVQFKKGVSVGFVRDGLPLAGGVCNPQTGEMFLGSTETGVFYNNRPAAVRDMTSLDGAVVLASRSEFKSGEWAKYDGGPFKVRAVGSVAYKLAPVAAGLADATWTLVPKHEWDVAAGVALVLSGGGTAYGLHRAPAVFNSKSPKLTGLIAHSKGLTSAVARTLGFHLSSSNSVQK